MRAFDIAYAVAMALAAFVPLAVVSGVGSLSVALLGMLMAAVAAVVVGFACR